MEELKALLKRQYYLVAPIASDSENYNMSAPTGRSDGWDCDCCDK